MGAALGICSAAQCAMCCGGTAASMCCSACPSCTNASSSRFMYAFILLVGTVLGAIALSPGLQDTLKKMPFCINSTSSYSSGALSAVSGGSLQVDCEYALGYMAVYRVCFGMACFFALMSLIMLGVKSSRDPRSHIQNNFWPLKFLICFGAAIGAIFIPDGSFGPAMMWVGLIGGLAFILVQLVIIVDFAHSLAENWIESAENSRGYYYALAGVTLLCYILSLTGITLLYIYFTTSTGCGINKFFISINLIFCLAISVISILPAVQERLPHSGLLQSSLVTLYTVYLTWSAVANNPEKECNPGMFGMMEGFGNATTTQHRPPTPPGSPSIRPTSSDWSSGCCASCTIALARRWRYPRSRTIIARSVKLYQTQRRARMAAESRAPTPRPKASPTPGPCSTWSSSAPRSMS
uniref:RE01085p n=1 Tax=Drosophila melanogaster TaxID=7227 RepID=E8NH60_DROME|nr:RE01085p [Drosophila melanogaster]